MALLIYVHGDIVGESERRYKPSMSVLTEEELFMIDL